MEIRDLMNINELSTNFDQVKFYISTGTPYPRWTGFQYDNVNKKC